MSGEIEAKIGKVKEALKKIGYNLVDVSPREFYDYMTGPIFSDDPTTMCDVLGNEYVMIHELVEIERVVKHSRRLSRKTLNGRSR